MPDPLWEKWSFGDVLVNRRGERVMFIRMTRGGFVGLCLRTDAQGERIGRLNRIDFYSWFGWKRDEA